MENTKSVSELQKGNHLQMFLYKVPKQNHDAIVANLTKFVPWFEKNDVGLNYYQLGTGEKMDGMEDIGAAISAGSDEEVWMELQYFRDRKHCDEIYAKMMKDKDLEPLGKEFFGLVSQGKSLIMGGFSLLKRN